MFMCFGLETSVINLDLTWKQSFLTLSKKLFFLYFEKSQKNSAKIVGFLRHEITVLLWKEEKFFFLIQDFIWKQICI